MIDIKRIKNNRDTFFSFCLFVCKYKDYFSEMGYDKNRIVLKFDIDVLKVLKELREENSNLTNEELAIFLATQIDKMLEYAVVEFEDTSRQKIMVRGETLVVDVKADFDEKLINEGRLIVIVELNKFIVDDKNELLKNEEIGFYYSMLVDAFHRELKIKL